MNNNQAVEPAELKPTTAKSLQQLQLQYATQLTAKIYRAQATLPLLGIGFLIAFVMNNFRYRYVNGTWLQTHFRWQVQTFIYGITWAVIGGVIIYQAQLRFPQYPQVVMAGLGLIALDILWIYYRIIKGGRRLKRGETMYRGHDTNDVFD